MAICLFSYLGVETAAVAAGKVRNPERNVPKSTIYGTLASAVVYMLSLIAVFGILPAAALASDSNQASYSAAADAIAGGSWLGYIVAIAVVISGIGALNGWTMICAEMPLAAAKDGLFPKVFGSLSEKGVPAFGIISSTVLASVAVVISYLGSSGATVFTTLVLMTGITAAIPYAASALAQLKWRIQDSEKGHTPHFALDVGVALVSLVMSLRVRLVLPQQRCRLVRRLGTVPDGRRRCAAGDPGLPLPALDDDRARPRARVQVRGTPMNFHVDSEVGQLKQAIVHRPGIELARLTPANVDELLFDDVMWATGPGRSTMRSWPSSSHEEWWSTTSPTCWPRRSTSPGPGSSSRTGSPPQPGSVRPWTSHSTTWSPRPGPPARRPPHRRRAEVRCQRPAAGAQPADGLPARRTTSCSARCRTTCSSGTTRPGSTTGYPSTRWPSPPGNARRSTPASSTTSTRCSGKRRSRSCTATTRWPTNPPRSRAATSPSSETGQ